MIKKLLILCSVLLYAVKVEANISIYPYSVDFEAKGRKRVQTVRVINTSDKPQVYRVSLVNFNQGKDGRLTEVETDDGPYARKYLVFSPRQFRLAPREVQTINVSRRGLNELKDGEYVSHLKIQEVNLGEPAKKDADDNETVSISLTPLFAVTIPVTIEKGDNLVSKTEVVSYKKVGNDTLSVTLKRLGNKSSRVNVVVLNAGGKEIGRLDSVKIYTTNTETTANVKVDGDLTGTTLKLEDARTKKEIHAQKLNM